MPPFCIRRRGGESILALQREVIYVMNKVYDTPLKKCPLVIS